MLQLGRAIMRPMPFRFTVQLSTEACTKRLKALSEDKLSNTSGNQRRLIVEVNPITEETMTHSFTIDKGSGVSEEYKEDYVLGLQGTLTPVDGVHTRLSYGLSNRTGVIVMLCGSLFLMGLTALAFANLSYINSLIEQMALFILSIVVIMALVLVGMIISQLSDLHQTIRNAFTPSEFGQNTKPNVDLGVPYLLNDSVKRLEELDKATVQSLLKIETYVDTKTLDHNITTFKIHRADSVSLGYLPFAECNGFLISKNDHTTIIIGRAQRILSGTAIFLTAAYLAFASLILYFMISVDDPTSRCGGTFILLGALTLGASIVWTYIREKPRLIQQIQQAFVESTD